MKGTLTRIKRSNENEREQPQRWEERDVCFPNVRQMRGGRAGPGGQAGTLKQNNVCIVLVLIIPSSENVPTCL